MRRGYAGLVVAVALAALGCKTPPEAPMRTDGSLTVSCRRLSIAEIDRASEVCILTYNGDASGELRLLADPDRDRRFSGTLQFPGGSTYDVSVRLLEGGVAKFSFRAAGIAEQELAGTWEGNAGDPTVKLRELLEVPIQSGESYFVEIRYNGTPGEVVWCMVPPTLVRGVIKNSRDERVSPFYVILNRANPRGYGDVDFVYVTVDVDRDGIFEADERRESGDATRPFQLGDRWFTLGGCSPDGLTVRLCEEARPAAPPAFLATGADWSEVELTDHSGQPFRVRNLSSPTLLVFWASWCGACPNELRAVQAATAELEARGIRWVPVSLDFDVDAARAKAGDLGLSEPWYIDPNAADPSAALYSRLGGHGIPDAVLLDADHRVAMKRVLDLGIEALLKRWTR